MAFADAFVELPGPLPCFSQADGGIGPQADVLAFVAHLDAKDPAAVAGRDAKMQSGDTTHGIPSLSLEGGYGTV
ncbi:hypothetical protein GCM10027082_46870 [Comamonas humi]